MSPSRDPRDESATGFSNPRGSSASRPRNLRNSRFAPEFLESRLSPSSFGITPMFAQVSYTTPQVQRVVSEKPLPTDPDGDPIPQPTTGGGSGPAIPS